MPCGGWPRTLLRPRGGASVTSGRVTFAGMLEYAAKKGWTTDDGSIRAHVEWEG